MASEADLTHVSVWRGMKSKSLHERRSNHITMDLTLIFDFFQLSCPTKLVMTTHMHTSSHMTRLNNDTLELNFKN